MRTSVRHCVRATLAVVSTTVLLAAVTTASEPVGVTPQQQERTDQGERLDGKRRMPGPRVPKLVLPGPDSMEAQLEILDADERVTEGVLETVAAAKNGNDPVELMLTYSEPLDSDLWDLVEGLGGEIEQVFDTVVGCSVRVPADQVDKLLADPTILQIDWNAPMTFSMDVARTAAQMPTPDPGGNQGPNRLLDVYEQQGAFSIVGTTLEDLTGDGVTIALVDSGVREHDDLDNLVGCIDLTVQPQTDPLSPYQSTAQLAGQLNRCDETTDPFGHGTHIAGILVGDGKSENGRFRGLAPDAELVSVRVLDAEGAADVADVITGIDWVIRNKDEYGIDILSLSLGGPFYVPAAKDPLVQAVEAAWNAGIVVVASAGNLGTFGHFTITRPGNSPKIITVGSLTDWNSLGLGDDLKSSYSSMSPTLIDGYLKPDLVAPGNRIISTRAPGSTLDLFLEPMGAVFNGVYLEMSGTSMAAPMVAATVALMLENEPGLGPDTIKARLMLTADPIPGNALEHGSGRLNVDAALRDGSSTTNASSPRVSPAAVCCDLIVEDMNGVWGPIWDALALWGDTTLWSDTTLWGETTLWGDTTLWGETTLWGDSTLWSDTVVVGE